SNGVTREYADGRATAALLGYLDQQYGREGLEMRWNGELSGLSRTFTGQDLRRMARNEAPRGNDLLLTLDLRLQRIAHDTLGERTGAIVVLDPATGGILGMATQPTYHAATLRADFPRLSADPRKPLRNRATQDFYPPGSTMKLVTAAAALMHGQGADTAQTCAGGVARRYGVNVRDFGGAAHGRLTMPKALEKSCNQYFAQLAAELPPADFAETAAAFGFGRRWWEERNYLPDPRMLPLRMAVSSLTPGPDMTTSQGERAHMGFGQSTVVATPLQMAMVAAAIANEGKLMAPYLVAAVRKGGTQRTLRSLRSGPIGFPLDRQRARELAAMMRGVVEHPGGTARGARVAGLTVYGKTGTAQQRGGADHAWFVGFAEREGRGSSPRRIAFAVLLERGGTGGGVAVPLAKRLLERWRDLE
ncbi:MAG TPA: penicillin-binding transpeptidase domain-containing protein, partial [Armatimonadota bacterium]|nr:penicillin-binding transpeptidase domain-containing protein [Armatimonadota bacterium]